MGGWGLMHWVLRLWPGWCSLALVTWWLYLLAGQAGREQGGTHWGPFPFPSSTVLGFITFSVIFIVVGIGVIVVDGLHEEGQ